MRLARFGWSRGSHIFGRLASAVGRNNATHGAPGESAVVSGARSMSARASMIAQARDWVTVWTGGDGVGAVGAGGPGGAALGGDVEDGERLGEGEPGQVRAVAAAVNRAVVQKRLGQVVSGAAAP